MKYRSFPQSGIEVSELSLGTMMFGGQTAEEDSRKIMDYAFSQGVNFFDTANMYNFGRSEEIVGRWIKDSGKRHEVLLATKVFNPTGEERNSHGLSRRHIIMQVEESLKRLQTDYIDVYYLHSPDYGTAIEESMYAGDMLVRAGKVLYPAVSNFAAWQVGDAMYVSEKRGYAKPVLSENVYNLLTRGIEAEFTAFIRQHPIGVTVYNPIAAGLLTGKHKNGAPTQGTRFANNASYANRYWSDLNFSAVEKLSKIAEDEGMSLIEFSMKWVAQHDFVTSIITGVSRLDQIKQNLSLLDGAAISDEALKKCDLLYDEITGNRFAYNR